MPDSLFVLGLAALSLGTIHEADGPVERTFWLQNAGQSEVRLRQAYTSCGCTTIVLPADSVVAAGGKAAVTLRFNPRGKGGEFLETGTVVYGPDRRRVQLLLQGTCQTSEETLLRQFPVRISERLRLSSDRFDLGIMTVGQTKERGVVVLHRDEADRQERLPVVFTATSNMGKGLHHIPVRLTTTEGGKKRHLTVTLDVVIK